MLIGIHIDKNDDGSFSDRWIDFFNKKNIKVKILDLTRSDALEQAKLCDGIMWRWGHTPQDKQCAQKILFSIEHILKIPVFPDISTSWHYDEKVMQYYLLQSINAPVPNTWVFWKADQAFEWVKTAPYPLIFKLSSGAGSSNVIKVNNFREAETLIKKMFFQGFFPYTVNEFKKSDFALNISNLRGITARAYRFINYILNGEYPPLQSPWWKPEFGYIYFQEFLPENLFDIRVTIIGNRAFAFRRWNRPNDFRASGSGNIDYDMDKIDKRCIEIGFQISKKCNFQSMAYDFLMKNNYPVVCEISYAFVDKVVYECPGHWDSKMEWHDGQMWPEEAQVEDFIKNIREHRT